MRRPPKVDSKLGHRLRRWPNIEPTLGGRLDLAGWSLVSSLQAEITKQK